MSDFYYLINKNDGIKLKYIEAHLADIQNIDIKITTLSSKLKTKGITVQESSKARQWV